MMTDTAQPSRPSLVVPLVTAAALITLSLLLRALTPEHLDPDHARRILGVAMGALVVFYSNAIPKALTPMMPGRRDHAADQAHRRFAGWSLVLGGLGFAAVWAVAPIAHATVLSVAVLGTALAAVIARVVGIGPKR